MCGRYCETAELAKLQDRFRFAPPTFEFKPRYNAAPSQELPIVVLSSEGKGRQLELFRWGLIPSWAKEKTIGYKLINARADGLPEKPSFRDAFKKRRCLVLADGFYEWKEIEPKVKAPMRVRLKGGEPFAMAGLWERWRSPEGREVRSFTIVTTEANKDIQPLHDRMPVLLRKEDEDAWLDPAASPDKLLSLLKPYPEGQLEFYLVTPAVNSPENDVPECVRPI